MDTSKTCYLFLDYDGTVFLNQQVPRENRDVLEAVQYLGHRLILNTGRSRGNLDFSQKENQAIRWDGVIFGASDMTYQGRRYHEHTLSGETVLQWVRYAIAHRYWMNLGGETSGLRLNLDKHSGRYTAEETENILRKVREWMAGDTVTKLILQRVDEGDDPVKGLHAIRMDDYAEVFANGRDKGSGFLDFCECYGIPKDQCVCFGDSLNDLAVFQVCPTGICMRNSPEILKASASYCAKGEFGVAEGVRWLFGDKLESLLTKCV